MLSFAKGRYAARVASNGTDVLAAQRLRSLAFSQSAWPMDSPDIDLFDDPCQHVLVEDITNASLVCCFRLMRFSEGTEIDQSYSAQFYDLSALHSFKKPLVEVGRFCIHPDHRNPDILRLAWGAMTAYVEETKVEMLFGCSSFKGTQPKEYLDAFAMLKSRHLAPDCWLPGVKAPQVFKFARDLRRKPDARLGLLKMPPLLRTYLLMGGWVSDHAVIDPRMNTLHVFTGLEVAAIPTARVELLRATIT